MKIGIDARTIINRRGIGNVVFHLLQGLSKIPYECSFVIYVDDFKSIELIPRDPRFSVKVLRPNIYPIWEQIRLPLSVMQDDLDILHCPGNSAPVFLTRRVKLVLSIMDVMFMFPSIQLPKSPSWYQRFGREYLKYVVPIVAKRAAAITTISSFSRNDITQYIDVPPDRVNVIWLAANESCSITPDSSQLNAMRTSFQLNDPFVLALGAVDPRKNTETILRSFLKFKQQHPCVIKLALVGLPSRGIEKFRRVADDLGIGNDVVFAGFVSEDDLVALYNAAELLLYPSLYEGFGLPILEAMKCGTPVITSSCGSIPEIAGDAALMADPHDEDAIANAIKMVLTNKIVYKSLVEKGKVRADLFSWQVAAEKTFAVYRSVMMPK
jgi:glycosyltransferase involved in cell wall biosynthesis